MTTADFRHIRVEARVRISNSEYDNYVTTSAIIRNNNIKEAVENLRLRAVMDHIHNNEYYSGNLYDEALQRYEDYNHQIVSYELTKLPLTNKQRVQRININHKYYTVLRAPPKRKGLKGRILKRRRWSNKSVESRFDEEAYPDY